MNQTFSFFSLMFLLCMAHTGLAQTGVLDSSFDDDGILTYFDAGYTTTANAILVLPDSNLLTVGERFSGFGSQLLLLGYQPDGSVNDLFGKNNLTGNPVWGYPGIVHTDVPGSNREYGYAAIRQTDGKLLIGGAANTGFDWLLARYQANGDIDSSFGGTGIVIQDWGGFDEIRALHLLADGKILAAGTANQDAGVARFDANGALDTGFGVNGLAKLALSPWGAGNGMAVDAAGRIYVCGIDGNGAYALGRLLPTGALDTGFGTGGVTSIPSNEGPTDIYVALTPAGLPLFVADEPSNFSLNSSLLLARFQENGSPDPAFGGGDGQVSSALGSRVAPRDLLIQVDGSILVAGQITVNGALEMCVAKYAADGSLDATFGTGGYAVSGLGVDLSTTFATGGSLALQADGKILLGGNYYANGLNQLALARFTNSIGPATGLASDLEPGPLLNLYPNPTSGVFHLSLPDGNWEQLTVRDLAGRLVRKQTLLPQQTQVDVSIEGLPSALYQVELAGRQSILHGKIRKQ